MSLNTSSETPTISNRPPLSKAQDYHFLREKGMEFVRDYAGDLWTDHNTHDPGITILEAMAFAFTEMGLRTQTELNDLLANTSTELSGILPPQSLLPGHPTTASDLQKILMDWTGVARAWVSITKKPLPYLFWNSSNGQLSLNNGGAGRLLHIQGLMDVRLQFDDTTEGGNSLRKPVHIQTVLFPFNGREFLLDLAFPFFDRIPADWAHANEIASIAVSSLVEEQEPGYLFATLDTQPVTGNPLSLGISIFIHEAPALPGGFLTALQIELERIDVTGTIPVFHRSVRETAASLDQIEVHIHRFRNLCEDINSLLPVRIQEVAIQADIDISPQADINRLIRNIFADIDLFIAPKAKRYNVQDFPLISGEDASLANKLNGPWLNRGLIDFPEDVITDRAKIYTSDLMRILMGVQEEPTLSPGSIQAVRNLRVSNYINNLVVNSEEKNALCLHDVDSYKPILSVSKSRLRFYQLGKEISLPLSRILDLINASPVLPAATISLTLPAPEKGTALDLSGFRSIQFDFPPIYGLGIGNLSQNASPERINQARQLQGYLSLFDQLLLNANQILQESSRSMGPDPTLEKSRFVRPIYNTPGAELMIRAFHPGVDDWQEFTQNPVNAYVTGLDNDPDIQLSERNRLLDHQLARYGEDFSAYERLMTSLHRRQTSPTLNLAQASTQAMRRVLLDKSLFLQDITILTRDRFKATNLWESPIWNTENVSGLERRIARLLGIRTVKRRNLYAGLGSLLSREPETGLEAVVLRDETGVLLLKGQLFPSGSPELDVTEETLYKQALFHFNYQLYYNSNNRFHARVASAANDGVLSTGEFHTEDELKRHILFITGLLQEKISAEGLYILEHILLRPTSPASNLLLPADLARNRDGIPDPYSARITVVFPSGFERDFPFDETDTPGLITPSRFQDPEFRTFAEQIVQAECPAHILPSIYWLDADRNYLSSGAPPLPTDARSLLPSFDNFERWFKHWLQNQDQPQAREFLISLLTNMQNIQTIGP